MDVIVDVTIRNTDGHILCSTNNKLFHTKSEPISEEYIREELDLRVTFLTMLPHTKEEIE